MQAWGLSFFRFGEFIRSWDKINDSDSEHKQNVKNEKKKKRKKTKKTKQENENEKQPEQVSQDLPNDAPKERSQNEQKHQDSNY